MRVRLLSISVRPTRRRRLRIVAGAGGGRSRGPPQAVWFNQDYLARALVPGDSCCCAGGVEAGPPRRMVVKAHEVVGREGEAPLTEGLHTQGLVPVYPATEAMPARRLRELVDAGPAPGPGPAGDPARLDPGPARPGRGRGRPRRPPLPPPARPSTGAGRRRLVVEELLVLQLGLAAVRRSEERVAARAGSSLPPARAPGRSWTPCPSR